MICACSRVSRAVGAIVAKPYYVACVIQFPRLRSITAISVPASPQLLRSPTFLQLGALLYLIASVFLQHQSYLQQKPPPFPLPYWG